MQLKSKVLRLGDAFRRNNEKIKNFSWSFISSMISTAVVQLAVQPILATMFDEVEYGKLLFVVGIANVLLLTLGNSLGDIRLTMNHEYENDRTGDFNVILLVVAILGAAAMTAFLGIYGEVDRWNGVFLAIYSFLGVIQAYLVCILRTKLMFRESFINNIILSACYMVGLLLVLLTKVWALVFVIGYLASVIYLIIKTKVFRHGFFLTGRTPRILAKYSQLSFSYAMKSSLTYVDRFIIYPILGAGSISVYTVATVLGKCISLALQPMANVMLGYYAQPDSVMKKRQFRMTYLLTLAFGVVMFIGVCLFSPLFIRLLYPSYVSSAGSYLIIGNLITIVGALSSIVQPVLLKYAKMHWQITIQALYAAIVIGLSLAMIPAFGLYGFCFAMLISNAFKLLVMIIIGEISINR